MLSAKWEDQHRKQSFCFAYLSSVAASYMQRQNITTRFLYIFVASASERIYVKEQNLPKIWLFWKYSSVFCDFVCINRWKLVPLLRKLNILQLKTKHFVQYIASPIPTKNAVKITFLHFFWLHWQVLAVWCRIFAAE